LRTLFVAEETTEDEQVDEVTDVITMEVLEDQSDYVNFPGNGENLVKNNFVVEDDHVNFPEIEDDNEEGQTTESKIQFYNQTEDNNAEVIVKRLKQFLEEGKSEDFSDQYVSKPKQTKVVYINNKRVELETDVSL